MTGAEVKQQVREVLDGAWSPGDLHEYRVRAALDGCVVLTAEEAEKVLAYMRECRYLLADNLASEHDEPELSQVAWDDRAVDCANETQAFAGLEGQ